MGDSYEVLRLLTHVFLDFKCNCPVGFQNCPCLGMVMNHRYHL